MIYKVFVLKIVYKIKMAIKLEYAILFSLIDLSIVLFSGAHLLARFRKVIDTEETHKQLSESDKMVSSYQIFVEELRMLKRRFWISFAVIEIALITFFLFWDTILFYNSLII